MNKTPHQSIKNRINLNSPKICENFSYLEYEKNK